MTDSAPSDGRLQLLALLEAGTRDLVRTVDGLEERGWGEPSLLPGWSRAHVVAHLTLNAEALAGALEAVHEGRSVAMYASQEARDADIARLAEESPSTLRDRFLASTTIVGQRVGELADNLAGTEIQRVPGGRTFTAGDVADMRVREVFIHHADLGLEPTAADWPPVFVVHLLDSCTSRHVEGEAPFTAYADDLDRSWTFGTGGPTVSGPGWALAWWATGRGSGQGLTSDDGQVPRTEAW